MCLMAFSPVLRCLNLATSPGWMLSIRHGPLHLGANPWAKDLVASDKKCVLTPTRSPMLQLAGAVLASAIFRYLDNCSAWRLSAIAHKCTQWSSLCSLKLASTLTGNCFFPG